MSSAGYYQLSQYNIVLISLRVKIFDVYLTNIRSQIQEDKTMLINCLKPPNKWKQI